MPLVRLLNKQTNKQILYSIQQQTHLSSTQPPLSLPCNQIMSTFLYAYDSPAKSRKQARANSKKLLANKRQKSFSNFYGSSADDYKDSYTIYQRFSPTKLINLENRNAFTDKVIEKTVYQPHEIRKKHHYYQYDEYSDQNQDQRANKEFRKKNPQPTYNFERRNCRSPQVASYSIGNLNKGLSSKFLSTSIVTRQYSYNVKNPKKHHHSVRTSVDLTKENNTNKIESFKFKSYSDKYSQVMEKIDSHTETLQQLKRQKEQRKKKKAQSIYGKENHQIYEKNHNREKFPVSEFKLEVQLDSHLKPYNKEKKDTKQERLYSNGTQKVDSSSSLTFIIGENYGQIPTYYKKTHQIADKSKEIAEFKEMEFQKMISQKQRGQRQIQRDVQRISLPLKKQHNSTQSHNREKRTFQIQSRQQTTLNADKFEKIKKIGQGTFGQVFLAKHIATNSLVCLKKISKQKIIKNKLIDQIVLQIQIQSSLNHPNTVGLYGFFDDSENVYIVMEYLQGQSLFSYLKLRKTIPEEETKQIIYQVGKGLENLHDHGIIHRDIKPENIIRTNGVYKLCDFGWSTYSDERRKTTCGTLDYSPPEILNGAQYDSSIDIWCLGVVTYELICGKTPFYHLSKKKTMMNILNTEKLDIQLPKTLSAESSLFILTLLRPVESQRPNINEVLKMPFLSNQKEDDYFSNL